MVFILVHLKSFIPNETTAICELFKKKKKRLQSPGPMSFFRPACNHEIVMRHWPLAEVNTSPPEKRKREAVTLWRTETVFFCLLLSAVFSNDMQLSSFVFLKTTKTTVSSTVVNVSKGKTHETFLIQGL